MWAAGTGAPVEGLRQRVDAGVQDDGLAVDEGDSAGRLEGQPRRRLAGTGRRGAGESTWSVGRAPLDGTAVGVAKTSTGWNVGATGVGIGVPLAVAVTPGLGVGVAGVPSEPTGDP